MSNFNSSQIRKFATDIANLLDGAERGNTKGDGFIEASIWNRFVRGGDNTTGQKTGNGKKSEIRTKISMQSAINSISQYIKTKSVQTISASLKALGINYGFDTTTVSNSNEGETTNVRGYKLGKRNGDVRYIEADSVRTSKRSGTSSNGVRSRSSRTGGENQHTNVGRTSDGYIGDSAQNKRGDCYFLASINAIRNTKNGQALLQKNCKKNNDGSYTITLPGAIKIKNQYKKQSKKCYVTGTYHISKDALDKASKSNQYSKGDIEVIAYELAMEAYRAEMFKTAGKQSGWSTAEGQFNSDNFGKDGDILSAGRCTDACFLLTGNKADVYAATDKRYKNARCYKSGEYGFLTRKEFAKKAHADISMYDNAKSCGISEVSHVSHDDKSLSSMLNKYQGQEGKYALTFYVRVAKNGPDGKTKAGGDHALSILKITKDTVYVTNPWYPDKIEPIPRSVFLQMATQLIAVPV